MKAPTGYHFEQFNWQDLPELYRAFCASFGQATVPLQMEYDVFEHRMRHKLRLDPYLSAIAKFENQIVAFVLHTKVNLGPDEYGYNGGMGVIPAHRGKQLSTRLYLWLMERDSFNTLKKVRLEVVTQNQYALKIYHQLGFAIRRKFHCFRLKEKHETVKTISISENKSYSANHENLLGYEPTLLDHQQHLIKNIDHECLLEAHENGHLVGFIIFQPHLGRISQLSLHDHIDINVLKTLLAAAQKKSVHSELTIMNIDSELADALGTLEALGFVNEIDQFEMELII